MYSLLADVVLIVHLAFIVFAVLGGLLVLRWPRLAWLHLPMAGWAAWVEFANHPCPLTPLENRLRQLAGEAGYQTSFIEHYLTALIYPAGLTRNLQILLGLIVVLINFAIYQHLWRRSATQGQDTAN